MALQPAETEDARSSARLTRFGPGFDSGTTAHRGRATVAERWSEARAGADEGILQTWAGKRFRPLYE